MNDPTLVGLRVLAERLQGTQLETQANQALAAYQNGDYVEAGKLIGKIAAQTTT